MDGEVTASLHLGTEQVQIEVADPETWERLATVAVEGARKMRDALHALEQASGDRPADLVKT